MDFVEDLEEVVEDEMFDRGGYDDGYDRGRYIEQEEEIARDDEDIRDIEDEQGFERAEEFGRDRWY
jgi:hypothetical protein